VETNAWGQTFSLRILAIRLAWQRGLLNRVILEDETTRLHAWLQTYASPEAWRHACAREASPLRMCAAY
jgi:hypothetical protein